jgi:plasmid stabilization system protein ParE
MKVVWTEHALRCLIEIEDYIAGWREPEECQVLV